MPDAISRVIQNESVVVLMRSKDDGEKASSSKFKVPKRTNRQTADDWLRTTRKNCTSIVMRLILAALTAGDFYGAAPTFSKRQLDACRQLKDGFGKYDDKWPDVLAKLRQKGTNPYQGFRLNLMDVAEVLYRMADYTPNSRELGRRYLRVTG